MGRRGLYPAIAGAVTAAAFALAAGAAPSRHFAEQSLSAVPVDVELVIAVDVSYSMDPEEQALQREGYVMALTSREFLRALREGANGKIAVTYFEWAGQSDQRVQATATEDATFAAYGAQTVHMPFGSVYTSLQTGVVDAGENSVNVYLINKHYEPAPVLSMTEYEANNAILWISDKLWQSLNDDQKKWVLAAGRDVSTQEPKKAFDLEKAAAGKLKGMGIKIVTDVDKSGFQKISNPMLDKLAKELGPHADKIKNMIVSIK